MTMERWRRAFRIALSEADPKGIEDLALGLQCPRGRYRDHNGEIKNLVRRMWVSVKDNAYCPLATLARPEYEDNPSIARKDVPEEVRQRQALPKIANGWFKGSPCRAAEFYEAWDQGEIPKAEMLKEIWDFYAKREKRRR